MIADPHAFRASGELCFVEQAVGGERLASMIDEASRLAPRAVRMHVPFVRRGGTVGGRSLRLHAPALTALYRELRPRVEQLVGRPIYEKEKDDDHALALYVYAPGDFMARHRDRCGSGENSSYSLSLGLINQGRATFDCEAAGASHSLRSSPGSLTVYNGTQVPHAVSRLLPGERRVVLSASYRTTPRAERGHRAWQELVEGWLYFGPRRRR